MANGCAFADKSVVVLVLPRRARGDEATFGSEGSTRLNMVRNTQAYRHRITDDLIFL
jgi:hypothetical protein